MTIGGMASTPKSVINTWQLKTAKKPSYQVTETPHQYVAHTFHFPGRIIWQPIELTFVDPSGTGDSTGNTTAALVEILKEGGYHAPTDADTARVSFSKSKFANALGDVEINQIDHANVIIDCWTMVNCFPTNVDFGTLDYASEELVINSMTLRYDYATWAPTQTKSG